MAVIVTLAGVGVAPALTDSRRVALVIGNGAYKNVPELPNPSNDASDVATALRRLGFAVILVTNASFEVKDVATLDGSTKYDLITVFDAVHDQAQPRLVLKGIADSLKPGGVFLCSDIAGSSHVHENLEHPLGAMMYTVSTFHCMTVSLALGGEGLGTMWGEQKALELMHEAGFGSIEVKQVEGDFMNNYYIARVS